MEFYVCSRCKEVVSEDDLPTERGYVTDYMGQSCYQDFIADCSCGGTWQQAVRCESCGEYFSEDDLDENYLCEFCAKEVREYGNNEC